MLTVTTSTTTLPSLPNISPAGDTCPECGGVLIEPFPRVEQVCGTCGVVAGPALVSPLPSEMFLNPLNSRGTSIGGGNGWRSLRDARGEDLSPAMLSLVERWRKRSSWNLLRSQVKDEKARKMVEITADLLDVPPLARDQAEVWMARIVQREHVVNLNYAALAGACLFLACRVQRVDLPVHRIVAHLQACRFMVRRQLVFKYIARFHAYFPPVHAPRPQDFLEQVLTAVGALPALPAGFVNALRARAMELLSRMPRHFGARPHNLAAVIVYAADIYRAREVGRKPVLTKPLVAQATGIHAYAINDLYQRVSRVLRD